jgi:DNA replication protein DnaC
MGITLQNMRRTKKNCGKLRKLTAQLLSEKLGNITTGTIPDPGCEKCHEGKIRVPKQDNSLGFNYEICDCLVEVESLGYSKQLLADANLPESFTRRYNILDWQNDPDLSGIDFDSLNLMVDNKAWFYVYGPTGTGKTYMALLLAQIAILKEMSTYFTTVGDLLDLLRPSENDKRESIKNFCRKADLLILDDIGHEKASEWVREQLYLLINSRWNDGKMTVFTSNYPPESLKERISDAVYSRVASECAVCPLNNSSDKRFK